MDGQNNLDLMQLMIDDHRARLRGGNGPRIQYAVKREPNRIRVLCGRMLILLGERVRGAQPVTSEPQEPRLAIR